MKKKRIIIYLNLTPEQERIIAEKAKEANLPRSHYCILSAMNAEIREIPPVDVHVLINEVRKVGTALDRVNDVLSQTYDADEETMRMLNDALKENMETEKMVREAYGHRWQ